MQNIKTTKHEISARLIEFFKRYSYLLASLTQCINEHFLEALKALYE